MSASAYATARSARSARSSVKYSSSAAAAIVARLGTEAGEPVPEWLDSRRAAEYLGVHRDTLRKLAAEHAIPAEQDGPGCKLFFRRSD
jgi:excisionase family DNA binding protein